MRILLLVMVALFIGCGNRQQTMKQLEEQYGTLIPYTPRVTFVHFQWMNCRNYNQTRMGMDCLYDSISNTYQVLSTYKIKP